MDTIFTYSYLETLAGGVAATILIAGFIENIAFFKKVPAYLIYYIIAETLIVLPHLVNADFQLKEIPLYILNGLLIAATAQKTSKMKSLDGKNGGLKP
jgi:hypothetical protein